MESVAEATSSLGETVAQMLPTLFFMLIQRPLELSMGF
ncbi:hypothetical protein M2405_002092 [Rhodococcus erythropolis]|jgi:hypothetical protein|nr:hypothetical protein N601_00825 [Rhodococcus erythropolis DN1]ERB50056.1 hypothetical protein N806_02460 [Rhodococcus sp. P27]MCS4253814.1 hypothetical protein [Rhodococcus erythropolis]OQM81224.1 hypothetical protein B0E55_02579 [Rhodococcus sp. 66b]MCW2427147.1 hypothetical protein [Rhodococcus erythropolis]